MWTSSGGLPCYLKEIKPSSELKEQGVSVIVGEIKGKENGEGFSYRRMPSTCCSNKVMQEDTKSKFSNLVPQMP